VLVVPLLLEKGGLASRVARVAVVDCPEDEQVRRVVARSGLAPTPCAPSWPRSFRAPSGSRARRRHRQQRPARRAAPQIARLDRAVPARALAVRTRTRRR
jgi:hypothetical protein